MDTRDTTIEQVAQVIQIDQDEPPLFNLEATDESDIEGDGGGDGEGDGITGGGVDRGGSLVLEGALIPDDIVPFGNGQLPDAVLSSIGINAHRLHQTAAVAFGRFRELAKNAGIELTCTDSYRTLDQQKELKGRKPTTSATPGRSVHGWGFAVDVSVGMPPKAFGMSVFNWLKENGPPNGWFMGRPKDEPWHWVYRGVGSAQALATHTATPGPAVAAPLVGHVSLSVGSSGAGVRSLRALLGLTPDDSFDAETDAAVRAFQAAHALLVDGFAGPKTLAALRTATAPADHPEISLNSTGDAVKWLQRRLSIGDDGEFGPVTDAAVKAFQQANGLFVDGRVGPRTWAALVA